MASAFACTKEIGRSQLIQGLRGLASLAVAWYHLTEGLGSALKQWGSIGAHGVEVFFVISGFVIPFSIWKLKRSNSLTGFPKFMARRLLRIEPPYLVSLIMVVILLEVYHHTYDLSLIHI